MTLSVAIQMDPVEGINIDTDTTFLLMLEAQTRGHALWVYTADKLSLEDGRVFGRGRGGGVGGGGGGRGRGGGKGASPPGGGRTAPGEGGVFDVFLMRQDPPF